jgi:hypothetical protein
MWTLAEEVCCLLTQACLHKEAFCGRSIQLDFQGRHGMAVEPIKCTVFFIVYIYYSPLKSLVLF